MTADNTNFPCCKPKFDDRCCCNCIHAIEIFKHPSNAGIACGSVTELMGYGCHIMPGQVIYQDDKHGICEMHTKTSDMRTE
jgi:hypothetical protein